MTDNSIPFEEYEEAVKGEWTEEINVSGAQLVETMQGLMREAMVRKISVVDKDGRVLIEIPLYAGVFGVFILGAWTALALIGAWFAEVSILIVREGLPEIEEIEDEQEATAAGDAMASAAASFSGVAAEIARNVGEMARRAADSVEGGLTAANGNGEKSAHEDLSGQTGQEEPAICQATTKSGKPCKNKAKEGSDFCGVHQPK